VLEKLQKKLVEQGKGDGMSSRIASFIAKLIAEKNTEESLCKKEEWERLLWGKINQSQMF
jgi:hypothetical protein